MDAVLNRIKSKVSSALPAGPGLMWKLYAAKKRSNQQEATVWEFEKKLLESFPKSQKEVIIDTLKHGVATLTRIRHPKILSVLQPLEESRESLAFASEPLSISLPSLLSQNTAFKQDFSLTDTEVKYGLLQVTEALDFLHTDCHRLHLNLIPDSIVVNRFGVWKLGGFEFSVDLRAKTTENSQPSASVGFWQSSTPSSSQPSLQGASPEAILVGQVTAASDMFSLGLLIWTLFHDGRPLLYTIKDYSSYRKSIKEILSTSFSRSHKLPDNLKEYVKMMLSMDPDIRPDALQFSQTSYFEDASMSVLKNVDNMYHLDNLARSQFYKSLPQALGTLPKRLCLYRVFLQITEDFSIPHMVPFILPAVLQITEMVSQEEFVQYMLPKLIPIMSMREPVQITLLLLQNLRILSKKFPTTEFRSYVLPMLHAAMDTDNRVIQELGLKSISSIGHLLETTTLKNVVLPRIQKLYSRSDLLSTRLACLVCLGKLMDYMDKWSVMDAVLPFLESINSREPNLLMVIFGIYRIAVSNEKLGISRDQLATRVLPHVIPLSIEGSLNLKQYSAYAQLIQDMCTQVEKEQRAKLEQLHGAADLEPNMIGIQQGQMTNCSTAMSCKEMMDSVLKAYVDSPNHLLSESASNTASAASHNLAGQQLADDILSSSSTATGSAAATSEEPPAQKQQQPAKPLTLEQKRQLAANAGHMQRLESQPKLTGLTPSTESRAPDRTSCGTRDLTSLLINSNLDSLNQTPSVNESAAFPTQQPIGTAPNYNIGAMGLAYNGWNQSQGGIGTMITSFAQSQQPASVNWQSGGSQARIPASTGITNFLTISNNATAPTPPGQYNLQTGPSPSRYQFKPLSKREIDDLLS